MENEIMENNIMAGVEHKFNEKKDQMVQKVIKKQQEKIESQKRKIRKQNDLIRSSSVASLKLPAGDVTKPWTKQLLQTKMVNRDGIEGFTLRRTPNVYGRI